MPTPPGFDRAPLVHGADERIPVETLERGAELIHATLPPLLEAAAAAQRRSAA